MYFSPFDEDVVNKLLKDLEIEKKPYIKKVVINVQTQQVSYQKIIEKDLTKEDVDHLISSLEESNKERILLVEYKIKETDKILNIRITFSGYGLSLIYGKYM